MKGFFLFKVEHGGSRCFNNNKISQIRDDYEGKIIDYCSRESLPLLGICRGAQVVAEYFGAKLERVSGHIGSHLVLDVCNGKKFEVNSFHNYGVTSLGDSLESLAEAEDSSIEAFKHKEKSIFALMWHIEREKGMQEDRIFQEWLSQLKE